MHPDDTPPQPKTNQLWGLWHYDYADSDIIAVYTSEERAHQAKVARNARFDTRDYGVIAIDLDPSDDDLDLPTVEQCHRFRFHENRDPVLTGWWARDRRKPWHEFDWYDVSAPRIWRDKPPQKAISVRVPVSEARTIEQAWQLAVDALAASLA